ncbi:MAG TPA: DPP IV N-terminal domain-containing protein, partial [Steroidobacter sp.]
MTRSLAIACLLPLVGLVHAQSTPSSDALAARIKAMAQIPNTFNSVYSNDGKRIAFLSNRSGTPQVWLVDTAGGEPKQITQEADPVGSLAWSPVDDTIAYDVARGGGYNAQVFLSKSDGTGAKRITSGGKEDNFSGDFAPDGRYWFRSALRNPQAPDSWIHDPKTGKTAIAIEYQGLGGISDIERPGNRALISRLVTRGNTNLALHDLDSHKEILLTPHEGPAIAYGELAHDGRAAYIVHNVGRDRLVVSRVAIDASGKPGAMTPFIARDDAEADTFALTDDGRHAVLTWNVGGRTELELVSLPDGKRTPLPAPPGEVVSISDISPSGDRMLLNVTGAVQPSSSWQY